MAVSVKSEECVRWTNNEIFSSFGEGDCHPLCDENWTGRDKGGNHHPGETGAGAASNITYTRRPSTVGRAPAAEVFSMIPCTLRSAYRMV